MSKEKYRIVHVKTNEGCYFKVQINSGVLYGWTDLHYQQTSKHYEICRFKTMSEAESAINNFQDCYQEAIVKIL